MEALIEDVSAAGASAARLTGRLRLARAARRSLPLAIQPQATEAEAELRGRLPRLIRTLRGALIPEGLETARAEAARGETALLAAELENFNGSEVPTGVETGLAEAARKLDAWAMRRTPDAYVAFVAGRLRRRRGETVRAAELLDRAAELEPSQEGRLVILPEAIEAAWAAGRDEVVERQARTLLEQAEGRPEGLYEAAMAHHGLTNVFDRRGEWWRSVEAARQSNFLLFRYGARQGARIVSVNYYRVACGLVELGEFGEGTQLAQLSLRGLRSWSERPSRAEALLLMARGAAELEDRATALKIIDGLLTNLEIPEAVSYVVDQARRLKQSLAA